MTRSSSQFFRLLLFVAGVLILIFAFNSLKGDEDLTNNDKFMWVSIGLMYLIFFLPFFFSSINIQNFSGKIPVLSMVWVGIFLYIAVSIVNIMLLKFDVIQLNVAIILQAVFLFIFMINLYFAYFTSSHVASVAQREAVLQQYLQPIKSKAQSLMFYVDKLPSQYESVQKTINKTLQDIKYISPVNNQRGDNLELQILQSLNLILEICSNISDGSSANLNNEADKLQMLVNERKLLKN